MSKIEDFFLKSVDFLGRSRLQAFFPAYSQGGWLEDVEASIAEHLRASANSACNWTTALDAYEGHDSVAMMTFHKSKGLEYHAVIFIGLDDGA